MKVKDLITSLQKFNPELEVVVDGYEGGVGYFFPPRIVYIDRNANREWYYGPHEVVYESPEECEAALKTKVVYLQRSGNREE